MPLSFRITHGWPAVAALALACAAPSAHAERVSARDKAAIAVLDQRLAAAEKRYNDYVANQAGWTDLIRQTKQREIQDMSARIQEFQENAQKQLQEREAELTKPIIDRAKKAIEDVAREGGYTYIFDGAGLLYSQDSEDIMPAVKRKLGI
jgi:Skp family chaperone for outer membrane proteins